VRILKVGRRALLVEVEGHEAVLGLYAEIQRRRQLDWPGPPPTDVVPAAKTVLIDGLQEPALLAAEMQNWRIPPRSVTSGELIECPTIYDGPDLEHVARCWQMTRKEAITTHSSISFYAAFCGFSPGFAYLAGLPQQLNVPRRASPRPSVPAGTVALAGEYSAIYPRQSPGGWQLIGRTDLKPWDPAREPPALIGPGTRVRFVEVTQ
jgi:KipI family sensor histidine kinase inhibitor